MTFTDAVKEILSSNTDAMTPQEIRERVETQYPKFYGTESHINNVEKGHYKDLNHALLAQIYSLVHTNVSFFCDKRHKPMEISLINDIDEPNLVIEDFENEERVKSDLEAKFHEEMLSIYYKCGRATGYWPNRFLQKVRKAGGLKAAKEWLKPEKGLSPGLQRLARENRIYLSMEALVLEHPWNQLFTKGEVK